MTDKAELFLDCRSALGEGPFWHAELGRLVFFDITAFKLVMVDANARVTHEFAFEAPVSAAAVIDRDTLAVAMAGALVRLDINTGTRSRICAIEPDRPGNRTNDSRVHPSGSFWIGTMKWRGDADAATAGNVHLYREGRMEPIITNIGISNSICFTADGRTAYFADTPTGRIVTCPTDPDTGRPTGPWRDFATAERGAPDGAVVDAEGYVWSARWGGSCVIRFSPDGLIDRVVELPVSRVTCPAFGGDDLRTLYVTSARGGLTGDDLAREPHAGSIFAIRVETPGIPEARLKL